MLFSRKKKIFRVNSLNNHYYETLYKISINVDDVIINIGIYISKPVTGGQFTPAKFNFIAKSEQRHYVIAPLCLWILW